MVFPLLQYCSSFSGEKIVLDVVITCSLIMSVRFNSFPCFQEHRVPSFFDRSNNVSYILGVSKCTTMLTFSGFRLYESMSREFNVRPVCPTRHGWSMFIYFAGAAFVGCFYRCLNLNYCLLSFCYWSCIVYVLCL